jgi:hypothetical protein
MTQAPSPALEFARVARALGAECHRLGIPVPAFRSPPKADAPRSIRRCPGGVVVAVRLRGRDAHDWTADMIDGCVAAAGQPEAAESIRQALWQAAGQAVAA